MKRVLLLLCVLALSFAYTDPPIAEVMGHNLDPAFLDSLMNRTPEGIVLGPEEGENAVYFNATLIGVFPSVDDRIPADPSPYSHKILWTWGENYTWYIIRDDLEATVGNSTCEFDGVTLAIDMEKTEYFFAIRVNNQTAATYDNPPSEIGAFDFPLSPAQLEGINATERMEVRLEYAGSYTYTAARVCSSEPVELQVLIEVGGHSELYYYVENGNVIFFTARPVLGEQWFRNNHFDNLIFSKRKFYKSEIFLDGNESGEARIYNFSIYTDSLGTMFINSSRENNYTDSTLEEYGLIYTPVPLIHENETFRYLYEENYTYEGAGYHNLTIVVTDHFLHNYTYNRTLLSRALSEAEAREEDASAVVNNQTVYYARPEYAAPPQLLNQVLLPSSALAIIFIVVAVSAWWGASRARGMD
ncbi:MAG: hypothetical protein AB1657_00040 [Candidatus Micrarchaeota archaeon]